MATLSAMQAAERRPARVDVLVCPEVTASVTYGLYDLFRSAGRDWGVVTSGVPGPSLMDVRMVSASGRPLRIVNGVVATPEAVLGTKGPPDVVCIPELFVPPGESLAGRFEAECAWLRDCHATGSVISSACSGSLLMAQAGLLDHLEATTHWAYCDALAARFPKVRLQRNRSLVCSGVGQRLVMAGGGTSWQDLGLYLVARFAGVEAAMQLARVYLIDWHTLGQQPYARLAATRQNDDAVIARAQVWAASHYDEASPVAAMARLTGMSERALTRRFRQATGMSPLAYVQTIRIEEAKQLLETSSEPIEAIAEQLGYEDASFFNRLFKREVRITPAQYRRKFGGLRKVLSASLGDGA